jgi:ribonuclease HII
MLVCGIDEAGRGALAGPVCAAAVVLSRDFPKEILKDSKKLSHKKRCAAANIIYQEAVCWGIGWAQYDEVDEINVLQASLLAMKRAFKVMRNKLTDKEAARMKVIVDGLYIPDINAKAEALVKADDKIPAVMAASILAKIVRDNEMIRLSKIYPAYDYEKHKGYPTKEHKASLAKLGASPIQRVTFKY